MSEKTIDGIQQTADGKKQGFLDELFSDGEQASWGRVGSFLALVMVLVWVTVLVFRAQSFADLTHIGGFVKSCGWLVALLYGISKINDTIGLFAQKE